MATLAQLMADFEALKAMRIARVPFCDDAELTPDRGY
jgi:hypothetical protein